MTDQPIEETAPDVNIPNVTIDEEPSATQRKRNSFKINLRKYWAVLVLITYIAGLGSGYILWGSANAEIGPAGEKTASGEHDEMSALYDQVNPPDGYKLPIRYGDFAPKLVAAGVIDYTGFVKLYQEIGSPLSEQQIAILTKGSNAPVVFNKENQHFLLNLFWALGLANQNKILTDGPMMRKGKDKVVNFASTGGWSLATLPVGGFTPASQLSPSPLSNRSTWKKRLLAFIARAAITPLTSRIVITAWPCWDCLN